MTLGSELKKRAEDKDAIAQATNRARVLEQRQHQVSSIIDSLPARLFQAQDLGQKSAVILMLPADTIKENRKTPSEGATAEVICPAYKRLCDYLTSEGLAWFLGVHDDDPDEVNWDLIVRIP